MPVQKLKEDNNSISAGSSNPLRVRICVLMSCSTAVEIEKKVCLFLRKAELYRAIIRFTSSAKFLLNCQEADPKH